MHCPSPPVLVCSCTLLLIGATAALGQAVPPRGFVDAAAVVEGLVVDMRYYGTNNFVGARIDGYERPRCLLTARAATALAGVQQSLAARGLGLKVFDCYRPVRAVAHFIRWARQPENDPERKAEYSPDIDKRDLFRLGYVATRSGHSRGSTVDLTLVRRADAAELDMGTPYDFAGPQSSLGYRKLGVEARSNRTQLVAAMRGGGFQPYSKEWWHYTLRGEPFPDSYFDFPVR
jgi:D-alanyl-D-alanine dipeptidase